MENELQFTEIEQLQEDRFEIKDDEAAEWALKKIRQCRLNHERFKAACNVELEELYKEAEQIQAKLAADSAELERDENYFTGLLAAYMQTLPDEYLKSAKTQKTYKLPLGKIVMKLPSTKLKANPEELLKALDEMYAPELVRVKREPDWANIKKLCRINGSSVEMVYTHEIVDPDTGEIKQVTAKLDNVRGVSIENVPAQFEVKTD